jgi:hypothetical protein
MNEFSVAEHADIVDGYYDGNGLQASRNGLV